MKTIPLILISFFLSLHTAHSSISIWAVPDSVRVNPQTGRIFENSEAYPANDRWQPEYRNQNSVWRQDGNDHKLFLWGGRNEYVSAQIVLEREDRDLTEITIGIGDLEGPETIPCSKNDGPIPGLAKQERVEMGTHV